MLPTPIAMQKIEEALGEHKWRLVDLFRDLDKNQDGKLQSDDFKKRCTQLGITEAMIDELLMAYGSSTKKLNYKVLAKGRNDLAKDKRVLIRGNIFIYFELKFYQIIIIAIINYILRRSKLK